MLVGLWVTIIDDTLRVEPAVWYGDFFFLGFSKGPWALNNCSKYSKICIINHEF